MCASMRAEWRAQDVRSCALSATMSADPLKTPSVLRATSKTRVLIEIYRCHPSQPCRRHPLDGGEYTERYAVLFSKSDRRRLNGNIRQRAKISAAAADFKSAAFHSIYARQNFFTLLLAGRDDGVAHCSQRTTALFCLRAGIGDRFARVCRRPALMCRAGGGKIVGSLPPPPPPPNDHAAVGDDYHQAPVAYPLA